MTFELVDVPAATVHAEVTMPLQHLCPFRDEVDTGTVTLTWDVAGRTVELHSLRAWLDTFADSKVSHEFLTEHLWINLARTGLSGVTCTTTWNTAGGTVTIRT